MKRPDIKTSTDLIAGFVVQNKYEIMFEKKKDDPKYDYSIDQDKLQIFLSKYTEESRPEMQNYINNILYVTLDKFIYRFTKLCDLYNSIKTSQDIYVIILLKPNSATSDIYKTSNVWTSFLSILVGFKYDYIFDYVFSESKTDPEHNFMSYFKEQFKNIRGKNIHLFSCDDCSYSGSQLKEVVKKLTEHTETLSNFNECNFYYSVIIPYVAQGKNVKIYNSDDRERAYEEKQPVPDAIPLKITSHPKGGCVIDYMKQFNDEIKNASHISKSSMYGNWLIYFQFKSADSVSVPVDLLNGKLMSDNNVFKLVDEKDKQKCVNFIKNCSVIVESEEKCIDAARGGCPFGWYKTIEYSYFCVNMTDMMSLSVPSRAVVADMNCNATQFYLDYQLNNILRTLKKKHGKYEIKREIPSLVYDVIFTKTSEEELPDNLYFYFIDDNADYVDVKTPLSQYNIVTVKINGGKYRTAIDMHNYSNYLFHSKEEIRDYVLLCKNIYGKTYYIDNFTNVKTHIMATIKNYKEINSDTAYRIYAYHGNDLVLCLYDRAETVRNKLIVYCD